MVQVPKSEVVTKRVVTPEDLVNAVSVRPVFRLDVINVTPRNCPAQSHFLSVQA